MTRLFIFPCFFIVFAFCGCEDANRLGSAPGSGSPPASQATAGVSDIVRATDDDFEEKTAKGVVLVDFYADWCGPCRMMDPHIEALATKLKDELTVVKVNTDNSPKTARKFGVRGIPALFVLVDGKPVKNAVGAHDEAGLRNLVADTLVEHGGKKKEENNESEEPASVTPGSNVD